MIPCICLPETKLCSTEPEFLLEDRNLSHDYLAELDLPDYASNIELLASNPRGFYGLSEVVEVPLGRLEDVLHVNQLAADFMVTNYGIRINLPIQRVGQDGDIYVAFLACGRFNQSTMFAIYLRKTGDDSYTRVYPLRRSQPDLLEIPTDEIVTSNIYSDKSLFIRAPQTRVVGLGPRLDVGVNVESLCGTLLKQGYTVFDEYGQAVEKNVLLREDGTFLIIENDGSNEPELMLVISLHPWIGIRAITLGPEGAIPRFHRDIYKMRLTGGRLNDLSPPSRFAVTKMTNGQEFVFVIVDDPDAPIDEWLCSENLRLLALPQTCNEGEEMLISDPSFNKSGQRRDQTQQRGIRIRRKIGAAIRAMIPIGTYNYTPYAYSAHSTGSTDSE